MERWRIRVDQDAVVVCARPQSGGDGRPNRDKNMAPPALREDLTGGPSDWLLAGLCNVSLHRAGTVLLGFIQILLSATVSHVSCILHLGLVYERGEGGDFK